jgi:predicted dienelactone hydrolase
VASELAVDAPVLEGRHPLVLYSHAATGSGHSMAFLAERMASRGTVVAAPDYPDAHFAARIRAPVDGSPAELQRQVDWIEDLQARQLNSGGRTYRRERLAYRPQVAARTIDRLLELDADPASPFHGRVDGERVAAVGHSFGAWTSLLLAGADPLFAHPRVRAVVAYTPPCNDAVFEPGELEAIAVPVLVMRGALEREEGRACDPAWLYDRLHPPKLLFEIEGADQLVFSGGLRGDFDHCQDYALRDPRRAAVVVHTMAFLDWVLEGSAKGRRRLALSTASVGARSIDWAAPGG